MLRKDLHMYSRQWHMLTLQIPACGGTAGAFGVNDVSGVYTNPVFKEFRLRKLSVPLLRQTRCIRPMLKRWKFSSISVGEYRIFTSGICLYFHSLHTVTSYIILTLEGPCIIFYNIYIIIIISIQLEGRFWQEPEPSQATGMALAHCILGSFLGVVCHCFPPPLDVTTFTSRCLHMQAT